MTFVRLYIAYDQDPQKAAMQIKAGDAEKAYLDLNDFITFKIPNNAKYVSIKIEEIKQ